MDAKRIVNQMRDSLRVIDRSSVEILKKLRAPPTLVITIGEAFCVVFNVLPTWENFLKLLINPDKFISRLLNYDINSFPVDSYQRLNLYIRTKGFNPKKVSEISMCAPSFCKWLVSFHAYQQLKFEPK